MDVGVPRGFLEHTLRTTGRNQWYCSPYQWFRMDMWPSSDKGEMKGILQSLWEHFLKDKSGPTERQSYATSAGQCHIFCICLGFAKMQQHGQHQARTSSDLPSLRSFVKLILLKEGKPGGKFGGHPSRLFSKCLYMKVNINFCSPRT